MLNQRDKSKTLISVLIREEDYQRIKNLEKEAGTSLARVIDATLHESLSEEELIPSNYEEIARRTWAKKDKKCVVHFSHEGAIRLEKIAKECHLAMSYAVGSAMSAGRSKCTPNLCLICIYLT